MYLWKLRALDSPLESIDLQSFWIRTLSDLFIWFIQVLRSDELLEAICLNKKELQWAFLKGSNVERCNALKYVAKCALSSVHSMHVFNVWVLSCGRSSFQLWLEKCLLSLQSCPVWVMVIQGKLLTNVLSVKWEWRLQSTNIASSGSWHAPYLSASGMVSLFIHWLNLFHICYLLCNDHRVYAGKSDNANLVSEC